MSAPRLLPLIRVRLVETAERLRASSRDHARRRSLRRGTALGGRAGVLGAVALAESAAQGDLQALRFPTAAHRLS